MPAAELAPAVRATLLRHGFDITAEDAAFERTIDIIRSRFSTLLDFVTRGRAYFSDQFDIAPESLEKLNQPGARELLRELGVRLEALEEFNEQTIEAELRKLAIERTVKAGLIINASRAALTGQPVGPSAFAVFIAVGRERALQRLRNA
jgi:Glutamyl- and glutaminyl-tRNA synthetases